MTAFTSIRIPPLSPRVSASTIRRLSHYLRTLEELEAAGESTISSQQLAGRGWTTAAQVRKDLSHFGSFGKRGLGYGVAELGLDRRWRVVLVGAGRIGSALFAYPRFRERGFDCVAVLDADPAKVGACWGDTRIGHVDDLERVIAEHDVDLVVLAVPATAAQDLADRAVASGARGLMNFAPIRLTVPDRVQVSDVNLVMEMEALSHALSRVRSDP